MIVPILMVGEEGDLVVLVEERCEGRWLKRKFGEVDGVVRTVQDRSSHKDERVTQG